MRQSESFNDPGSVLCDITHFTIKDIIDVMIQVASKNISQQGVCVKSCSMHFSMLSVLHSGGESLSRQ